MGPQMNANKRELLPMLVNACRTAACGSVQLLKGDHDA